MIGRYPDFDVFDAADTWDQATTQVVMARLNRDGRLDAPPAELRELLVIARHVARASGGAFDPTVQPLWLAFAQAHSGISGLKLENGTEPFNPIL